MKVCWQPKTRWRTASALAALTLVTICVCGCRTNPPIQFANSQDANLVTNASSNVVTTSYQEEKGIEYPAVNRTVHDHEFSLPPLTSADALPPAFNISLDEALQTALGNTSVLRSLGAQVLRNPQSTAAIQDPSINATDPIFGVEAALAQFDAQLAASLNHSNNDDVFNNSILGGGATEVVQDLSTADLSLSKTAATGTRYSVRSNVRYDNNDNPTSTFPSSYSSFWEAQARQPLLQGRGLDFNRIAGPTARPGFRNTSGVLISRVNHDISIAQFEQAVRGFVDETLSSYWDLYFAYRNFESAKRARDVSLETWNTVKTLYDNDLPGGEADKEAQSREQYYIFQQQVITALNGDPRAGVVGVLQAEANLRRMLGMPQNDGRLLRPADEPIGAKAVYDWTALVNQSLDSRVELRQQMWRVKRTELELLASRNFMLPRLDAVATFRNNGFGDDLTGGSGRFSSAVKDMASGDHNEWEMGLQLNVPIGFRQAASGVRNSELKLFRERAVLDEQEKQIIHDLGTAVRQTQQYDAAVELAYNRLDASLDTAKSREVAFEADAVPLDLLLEAQRRVFEAQTAYHRAQVDLQLATESVSRESGQLLANHAIDLIQSPTCNNENVCVERRRNRVATIKEMDYRVEMNSRVSR